MPAQLPRPAAARASWLNRLTISRRLLLLAAVFTLPLGAMLTLIDLDKDIASARRELDGNAYQRDLVATFAAVADHQRLADALVRKPTADRSELLAARQRVDAALTSLAATDASIGESLQFTPDGLARRKRGHVRVETVRQEWDAASQAVHGATPNAAAEAHAHLLTDLRTMTAHAGDTSNLILDPDLDSSYAMDMTLLALPQTQQRTAGLLVWLQQAHGRRLTAADRRHLAVTAAFLREADRDRIVADAETSINADADSYGASETLSRTLKPAVATYAGAASAFADTLDAAVNKRGKADLAPAVAAGLAAQQASLGLWRTTAGELDSLLQLRIRHHEAARLRALGVTGLAWAGALAIAFYISRSVSRPLAATARQLASSAQQVASTASQVSASALSLARGASEQAASLEETSASLEELASMTRRNADYAAQAATLVTGVSRQVDESNAAFSTMVASMSGDSRVERQGQPDHQDDRRDRLPDEHPGPERGRRSGAGRRGRHGLRGGRGRSPHAGAAIGAGGQGHRRADRGIDRAHRRGCGAGRGRGAGDQLDHRQRLAARGPGRRRARGQPPAVGGHRPGLAGDRPDGARDADHRGHRRRDRFRQRGVKRSRRNVDGSGRAARGARRAGAGGRRGQDRQGRNHDGQDRGAGAERRRATATAGTAGAAAIPEIAAPGLLIGGTNAYADLTSG